MIRFAQPGAVRKVGGPDRVRFSMGNNQRVGNMMSRTQHESGKDPEVKRKANEIIAASEKDIADLKKWKSQKGTASR